MKHVIEDSSHPLKPRRCIISIGKPGKVREYAALGATNSEAYHRAIQVVKNSMQPRMVRGKI
ncbi:hypothetical protein [Gilvimarinus chinensis]|uniref:hypothetical protein n=1 Tax=Gilvimarinus chinensis TaxID=396005 RepID=UPI0003684884|nr:hypothetical protein [Gilvimarinus chinensis]